MDEPFHAPIDDRADTDARARVRRRRRNAILLLCLAGGVLWLKPMGLLLWARLRILTSIPRTAVAEPAPESDAPALPDERR